MSPLYRVLRGNPNHSHMKILRTELLEDGEHLVEFAGATVPIHIAGNELLVNIIKASGSTERAIFPVLGRNFAELQSVRGLISVAHQVGNRDPGLMIRGSGQEGSLYIERHNRPSKNFPLRKERE